MRRMENHSPSLGDQIARLRGAAQAEESCAWLPDALHALIMACFARIFSRLERFIQLWQAGQLLPPPPRATFRRTADDTSHQNSSRPHPARQIRHSTHIAIARTSQAPRAAMHHPIQPASITHSRAVGSPAHPRPRRRRCPARAPPRAIRACRLSPFCGVACPRLIHYVNKT